MSTYRLERLFNPRSVAIVGASAREGTLGYALLRNMRAAGFAGAIWPVNPHYESIDDVRTYKSIADLPGPADVVVIAVPPQHVLTSIEAAAQKDCATGIVITAGLGQGPGSIADEMEKAARRKGLRIIGPNCLGVLAPAAKFNGSFSAHMPRAGDLALISQSGAIGAGMIEWAAGHGVGFSAIASVGDQRDVDIADLLDYFAVDRTTSAILLYVEAVRDARKFMSAARASARVKPVVVIKSGRFAAGAKAAATHTGALAGSDAVYDAAFRRAGLLRVFDLAELFDAAEALDQVRSLPGQRLAILTNGGGLGVLAVDQLAALGGKTAELSPATRARLDATMPPTWSHANPVDIIGDADAARFRAALEALLDDPASDAVLTLYVRTAVGSPVEIATALADTVKAHRASARKPKPMMAVWLGSGDSAPDILTAAQVPVFASEADAVRGFMHVASYQEIRKTLMQMPPSLPAEFKPDSAAAQRIVAGVLKENRNWLDPVEVFELLTAYAIPATPIVVAKDPEAAISAAKPFLDKHQPVAVKIFSRDITHKSDVDGVRLDLADDTAVREAAAQVISNAKRARPDAVILGVTVQPMITRKNARELIAGIADDPTFGPVVMFGHGGTAVEAIDDKALALPPLDLMMAHDLIARTRVARLLRAYRNIPAIDQDALALVLVKLSRLAADLPELHELDLNPVLADETGVIALDARVAVRAPSPDLKGRSRLAVRPYPVEWERDIVLPDNSTIAVRPIRPEDEPLIASFLGRVTQEDLRLRFFATMKEFGHAFIARLTQIDYARAMAFVALDKKTQDLIGVVRLHSDANYDAGEYAVLVRSDLKGHGLGWKLMEMIIEYARSEGLQRIFGQVLCENATMLRMCRDLGFEITDDPSETNIRNVTLKLR
ncbi:MAG: bifunctional acetate--CoA ligase family protein/GNAT family N-acetyltransferase [Xanthobacteraceae bacterium]